MSDMTNRIAEMRKNATAEAETITQRLLDQHGWTGTDVSVTIDETTPPLIRIQPRHARVCQRAVEAIARDVDPYGGFVVEWDPDVVASVTERVKALLGREETRAGGAEFALLGGSVSVSPRATDIYPPYEGYWLWDSPHSRNRTPLTRDHVAANVARMVLRIGDAGPIEVREFRKAMEQD